jgi:hypothetical protein
MEKYYKNGKLGGIVDFLPAKMSNPEISNLNIGDEVIINVDVSQARPEVHTLRYALILTNSGFRVDWIKSQKLTQEDQQKTEFEKLGFSNLKIQVKVLKIYQSAEYYVDVEVQNLSNAFISFYDLKISVYDKDKNYLGSTKSPSQNLKSNQKQINRFILPNISTLSTKIVDFWQAMRV